MAIGTISNLFNLLFTEKRTIGDTNQATNLDTITEPGWYHVLSNSSGNFPEGTNGELLVVKGKHNDTTIVKQFFMRYGTLSTNDGNIYHRYIRGSNVGSWWRLTGTKVE